MHMHGFVHTHGFTHLNVTRLRQIVTHILGILVMLLYSGVVTVELHLYMIFPITILICYLIIINAIFPYLIVFLKNKLKWSNNGNNTCVCNYIAWKVHISIITVW